MTDPTAPATPAPVLVSINVRKAANGVVVGANFQDVSGLAGRMGPQQEYIFASSADMLAWLKAQGWNI